VSFPLRVAPLVALLFACASPLAQAKSDYREARYAEAKAQLVALEGEAQGYDGARRAEHALYLGLVHLALGDQPRAAEWLAKAERAENEHPGSLGNMDLARLRSAKGALVAAPAAAPGNAQ
jgi:hypothetical protein